MSRTSLLVLCALAFTLFAEALWADRRDFPRYKEIVPNIQFWTRVYSEWRANQVILFDAEDMRIVYDVLDFPVADGGSPVFKYSNTIEKKKKEIVEVLKELDKKKPKTADGLLGTEKDIFNALKNIERPDKYQRGDYIRSQNGLREQFERGVFLSGSYDIEMRLRLRREKLPDELIAVVFVESLFHPGSRSRVGAGGLWQFMPRTAKQYMFVNRLVDERYDPIVATDGAIKYLKSAHERLKSWPLAITAYNYGAAGIARAQRVLGSTDYMQIIQHYDASRFGFASKNYYPEFLAALDVYENRDHYFKNEARSDHWDYDVVKIPNPVYWQDLVAIGAVDNDWCLEHNPAISDRARQGLEVLPPDFTLRVPEGAKDKFFEKTSKLEKRKKLKAEGQLRAKHLANGHQSISQIAKLYDVFQDTLAKRLGYPILTKPKKGTVIMVRSSDGAFSELPSPLFRPRRGSAAKVGKPLASSPILSQ